MAHNHFRRNHKTLKELTVRKSQEGLESSPMRQNLPVREEAPAGRLSLPAGLGVVLAWLVGRVVAGHCGELTPSFIEVSGLWQKVRFLYSSSDMKVHNNNEKQ